MNIENGDEGGVRGLRRLLTDKTVKRRPEDRVGEGGSAADKVTLGGQQCSVGEFHSSLKIQDVNIREVVCPELGM